MKQMVIILIVYLILGCSKEPFVENSHNDPVIIDTVFPKSYFPVYPNSYWVYLTSNNDTVIHKTDSIYSLHTNYDPLKNPYDSSLYYAPKYDGKTVGGYFLALGTTDYHSSRWKVLMDDSLYVGKVFRSYYIWPNSNWYGKVMHLDTTIIIQSIPYDSVHVIMEYSDPPGYNYYYQKYYYAKNIGIIKFESWNWNDNIYYEENIVEYTIGH